MFYDACLYSAVCGVSATVAWAERSHQTCSSADRSYDLSHLRHIETAAW